MKGFWKGFPAEATEKIKKDKYPWQNRVCIRPTGGSQVPGLSPAVASLKPGKLALKIIKYNMELTPILLTHQQPFFTNISVLYL